MRAAAALPHPPHLLRPRLALVVLVTGLTCALAPCAGFGQEGFQLSPALSLSQVYDDQFAAPGAPATKALLVVASPRLGVRYGSQRVIWLTQAAIDAEMFDTQPGRGLPYRRWAANSTLSARATERLDLAVNGTLLDSDSPRDISLITGLDQGLVRVQAGSANAAITYALSELTAVSFDGGFSLTRQSGRDTTEGTLRGTTTGRFTQRDTGRLQLLFRRFTFDGTEGSPVSAILAGWDRRLTEQLRIELLAGPRFTSGVLEGVEGFAALRWEQTWLDVRLGLASTQGAVPGLTGLIDTVNASLQLAWRPTERFTLTAAPTGYLSSGAPLKARVFELRLEARQAVTPWLSLFAGYRFTAQRTRFTAAGLTPSAEQHHQLAIGASFSAPASSGQPSTGASPSRRP